MASPRKITTALKVLSPRPLQNSSQKRQYLCPVSPVRNSYNENRLTVFNVDTPNRMKILEKGLSPSKKCHCVLGTGGFGTVYKACYKGDQVAAKVIPTGKHSESAINSEKHATFLRHSNIVRVLTVEQGKSLSLVTMELCSATLQNRLDETPLKKGERVRVLRDVVCALNFCHDAGIVHADVKPKNILMTEDGRAKLTDFGSSVLIGDPHNTAPCYGTPGYVAPEVLKGDIPTPAADMYSVGIVAWQMLSRTLPFASLHAHTIIYLTGKEQRPTDEELNDDFDGRYKELYRKLWSQNSTLRPTATETINIIDTLISQ